MASEHNETPSMLDGIRLLSDRPLAADYAQSDRFGHSGIAESLQKIILSCPVPFTVGLFGKWGTGKTSILNILASKLSAEKIPVIKFDVWKHEGDALRRTFLLDLVNQLKEQLYLSDNYKISTRLDKEISTERNVEKIGLKKFILVTIAAILFLVIAGAILKKYYPAGFDTFVSVSLSGSFIAGLLIWLFTRIIVSENITEHADRLQDPVEFENEFERAITGVGKECDRVLIAIDNIDRCMHDKAIELLATIKTFMAKDEIADDANRCVFLIPCDDKAIKERLKTICGKSNSKDYDADEFLRKFFNASVTIPDFIDTDLQRYNKELLKETQIPEFQSPDLAFVITTAFYDNPRQIKQFINILISHFLLARIRENGDSPLIVPPGTITKHIEFLAKFLIVRQKFPVDYKKIVTDFMSPEAWGELDSPDFKKFHIATNMFVVKDIRPYIYLKQSEEERQISGLSQIERGLLENDVELVVNNMKDIDVASTQFEQLEGFLVNLLTRYRGAKPNLINIIACLLAVSNKLKMIFSLRFYTIISHILSDSSGLKDSIYHFDVPLIFAEVLFRSEAERNTIVDEYVSYLCNPKAEKKGIRIDRDDKNNVTTGRDFAYVIMKELLANRKWLTSEQKGRICKSIETSYYADVEFLALFQNDTEAQKDIISDETLSKFISAFSDEDVKDKTAITEKVQLLLKFRDVLGTSTTASILSTLTKLLESENALPLQPSKKDEISQKENLLNQVEDILFSLSEHIQDQNLKNEVNALAELLLQGTNNIPNLNDRKIFIPSCFTILNSWASTKGELDQIIRDFFTNANLESIKFAMENRHLDGESRKKLIDKYAEVLKSRVIGDESILDYLYPMASPEACLQWLIALIENNPGRAVQKLESLEYRTDNDQTIVQALLNKASKSGVKEKSALYNAINKMKCASDDDLQNQLEQQLKNLLTSTDLSAQEVGYKAFEDACSYLSDKTKRDIATKVIDWLRSPEITDPYQPFAIRSIVRSWPILHEPAKKDYIYFIFHNLIMPKSQLDAVKLGFEILSDIKCVYETDNKTYFEDALTAAIGETRHEYKTTIISGLVSLKPQEMGKNAKAFFDKLDKQQKELTASKKSV